MEWDGWERRQVSEKRRLIYSNDDREQEREKKNQLVEKEKKWME